MDVTSLDAKCVYVFAAYHRPSEHMVLMLNGNSRNVAHVLIKTGLFRKCRRF